MSISQYVYNKHNNFFIMLERNSVNVHSNTRPHLALQKWEPASRIGGWKFFLSI